MNKIVDKYTMAFEADISLDTTDEVLKHSKLFIRDALTFWVFSDAVRHEDVGTMWLVYSFWLFMFRGAGCHNYGNEILEMVAQFTYEMGASLQEIVERTWLVNRWGKPGRAIPTDRYLEINNGFIKVRYWLMFQKSLMYLPPPEHICRFGKLCIDIIHSRKGLWSCRTPLQTVPRRGNLF